MKPLSSRPIAHSAFPVLALMVGLMAALSAPVVMAASSEVIYEGQFDAGLLIWDQDAHGLYIPVLDGTQSLKQPGLPDLPVLDIQLLVPAGRQVLKAWVEPLATHTLKAPGELAVAADLVSSEGEFLRQSHMAAVDGVFPAQWGAFKGNHVWRGYGLLAVGVHPLRQGPEGLEFMDSFAIHVQYGDAGNDGDLAVRERFVPGEKEDNQYVLKQLVKNPEKINGYARQSGQVVAKVDGGFLPTRTPSLSGSPVQYLIVTNEEMAPEFQRLADHKNAMGIATLVVTREFIAANFRNGADIQETIRMFIKDAYAKWGTEYVLLGGDTDVLPARMIKNTFYPAVGHTEIPVDLYFAALDGNWNADGDAFYGQPEQSPEPGDEVDFAEEVYIGRATVSTFEAATVFVNKTISYESTPAGTPWPSRVLYASEVLFPDEYHPGDNIILDGAQFSHQMVDELVDPCTDMEFTRMYETDALFPREAPLTKNALVDSLNTGHYGIFNQIGHGFYFNMSVGDGNFMTFDADALTNGDNLFALFSLNCASCAFDYSCLMERFLQNPNGGSVVSIGSARAAFPNTSNNYQQEFFDNLYCGGENRVGRLVALSRLPFLPNTVYNYVDRWTFENYTLLGDPTLALWTGSPDQIEVVVNPLNLGPNSVTVEVTRNGWPVEGALVNLMREGEDQAFGITSVNGQVVLEYLAVGEGQVQVTVSGRNLELTSVPVGVANGVSYLAVQDMNLQDGNGSGSSGNANGEIEAGEILALWPVLQETAGGGASSVTGVVTCDDPRVTILDGNVTFPNISGGGQVNALDPFLVQFDADISDGTPLNFDVVVSNGSGQSYPSVWDAIVKAPEFETVSIEWEDSTYGNGDNMPDSGERVILSVRVKNFGAGLSGPLNAYLRTDNANIVLFDTLGTYSPLELMDEDYGTTSFSLALVDNARKSKSYIVLEDEFGRTSRQDFHLQRPVAPEIIETDSSLGADVIAIRWSPSNSPDVLGYNVMRSTAATGPFQRVNSDVVAGVSYYRDENLDLLTRYYYRIETVDDSLVGSEPSIVVQQATSPAELSGFPVPFTDETSGHLAVGDVDGDGDQEVVLASDEVYVWHHDGSELLNGDGDSQTLGQFTNLNTTLQPSGIVLAQMDNVPGLEMIVSERGNTQAIHVFRKDGTELPGWPQTLTGQPGTDWNWATPAVGDVDGDGSPEVVVNTVNGLTWVWHADGTELRDGDNNPATNGVFFKRDSAQYEWSHATPALYDLDGDGAKDIIFGTKANFEGQKVLLALKYDGSHVPGFPYVVQGSVDNSCAIGDLNGDGIMEIVFYDWSQHLYAVQQDGTDYPGFPVFYSIGSDMGPAPSVALGDMDDDQQLEIMLVVNITGDESTLMLFDTDVAGETSGTLMPGWPKDVPGSSEGSPVLGDIDGDSQPDILYGIGGGSEEAPNNLYAFHASGQPIDGFPITVTGPLMPAPVICDLDHDFDVDIVYGGWGRVVHVWDMPFAYDRRNVPWPTFHGNMRRDGVFFPLELVGVEEGTEELPSAFTVGSPYPNPFNPSTSIRLYIPGSGDSANLELAVYDLQGRKIRVLHQGAISTGWHTLVWDGRDDKGQGQASGMYFMRAQNAGQSTIKKMTLVK